MSEVDVFAQVMVIVISSIAALVALGVGARFVWTRTSRAGLSVPRADSDRLQRLEEAVDTIAVEIERMSEAQRFTAKLLLERGADAAQTQATQSKVPESIINPRR
jgi:hypothetical protein